MLNIQKEKKIEYIVNIKIILRDTFLVEQWFID